MGENHKFLGSWICSGQPLSDRRAPIFKREFNVTKAIKKAQVFVCGLGLFELKINGELPDDSVLNPAHTQYSKTVLYRVFDVTSLLTLSKNTITVELGNSFFNETTFVWNWDTASWRSSPKLILDLVIEYTDNTTEVVFTDESFKVALNGPIISNSIYYGEAHDMRNTDLIFADAIKCEAPAGELKEQKMPPIRRINEIKPLKITKIREKYFVIEAPEMITGWAKFKLNLPKDTEVTVTYSERLNEDGTIYKIGKGIGRDGNWWPDGFIQQDKFISNGEECFFEPKFSYKGFKYIGIENCPQELLDEDVILYRVANDVKTISSFSTSNPSLNELHLLMRRTILNNLQGKPTDTPVWEKNGWLGDLNCGLQSMLFNFELSEFLKSFIDTMVDCFHEFSSIPVMVPSANWSIKNSPVWNSVFVFSCEELLRFYDEKAYVKEKYNDLKAFALNDIEELKENSWTWGVKGLADWVSPVGHENYEADPGTSEGAEICGTAFIYKMLESMIFIAEEIGENEDIKIYNEARVNIFKAFNEAFFNNELKIYETNYWEQKGDRTKYRQTSNLLPIAFGLVPDSLKDTVLQNLVKDIKNKGYHLDTGCIGTKYILLVLFNNGETDVAFKILTQTTYPSWCSWLLNGDTSAYESWENTTRSKNHYFLGTYEEAYFSCIMGVKEIKNGFKEFTLKPALNCGLSSFNASLETKSGALKLSFEKQTDKSFKVLIKIPKGSKVNVVLENKSNIISKQLTFGEYEFLV